MRCARSGEELISFMDGELSPLVAAEFARHLAGCTACRRELSQLMRTASLVHSLGEVTPPADLEARIAHKAAQPRAAHVVSCAAVRNMLDDYVHGHLAQEKANRVAAHLSVCEACSRRLRRLEQNAELLHMLDEVSPPARIRQRVEREAARRARLTYAKRAFRRVAVIAGAAAAGAAIVLAMRVAAPPQPPSPVAGRPRQVAQVPPSAIVPVPTVDAEIPSKIAEVPPSVPGDRLAGASRRPTRPTASAIRVEMEAVREDTEPVRAAVSSYSSSALPIEENVGAPLTEAPSGKPLYEVRQALREQGSAEAPTLRSQLQWDRFFSSGVTMWVF